MELQLQVQLQNQLSREKTLETKSYFSGYSLVVYVDYENLKYYLDVFAASALGLVSYQEAGRLYDSGQKLFEISQQTLDNLREIFDDRIIYISIKEKENKPNQYIPVNDLLEGEDEFNNKKDEMFRNYLGDEINNYYQEFKASNSDLNFDEYMKKISTVTQNEVNDPVVK